MLLLTMILCKIQEKIIGLCEYHTFPINHCNLQGIKTDYYDPDTLCQHLFNTLAAKV